MLPVGTDDIDRCWIAAHAAISNVFLTNLCNDYRDSTAVRHVYYRFLYHLILALQPAVAVELGVEFGLASAHMCEAAKSLDKGIHVIGVDHNWHGVPGFALPLNYDFYRFVLSDTVDARVADTIAQLTDAKIGLVFQDSSHHYAASCAEWDMYRPLMADGGLWVCDDISPAFKTPDESKGMMEYFHERPGTKMLYPYTSDRANAIGVVLI